MSFKFNPCNPCCSDNSETPIEDCSNCPDGTVEQWTFTLVGITDTGGCPGCLLENETVILTNESGQCRWFHTRSPAGFCDVHNGRTHSLALIENTYTLDLAGGIGPDYLLHKDLWDCNGPNVMEKLNPTFTCGGWPDFITVEPV